MQTAVEIPVGAAKAVVPGSKQGSSVDLAEVQQVVLRIANELFTGMVLGVDALREDGQPVARAQALKWKTALGTSVCTIASGPNAVGNLLDLTVFVTVLRTSVQNHWQPSYFGDSARLIMDVFLRTESEVWGQAAKVLSVEQQQELRDAIEEWCRERSHLQDAMTARAAGWATEVGRSKTSGRTRTGSVFNLLMLDPFAGLDPATREITQSRLLAERGLFVAQKMPELLRWHTELLAMNATETPAMQQLVANTTLLSGAIERMSRVAERLPGQVTAEREAILRELEAHEAALTPLMEEVRRTLLASAAMSTSWNVTLTTFDALMKRFGVGEDPGQEAGAPSGEPFRIGDYGRTAEQLEAAAGRLTELLVTLERTLGSTQLTQLSAQVGPVVDQVQGRGKEMVDYAFGKAVQWVLILFAAALVYRFLTMRMMRSRGDNRM